MYRSYDTENGIGPTIYRSPAEIREDIRYIKEKIKSVNLALNLREMLTSILDGERGGEPEMMIDVLSDVVEEAKSALEELRGLEEELYELEAELGEVKWITIYLP